MPDYDKSKIYLLKIKEDNAIYIGSTIQELKRRLSSHKKKGESTSIAKYINEKYNGDWSVVSIELYEECSFSCKSELHKKEGEIIKLFKEDTAYNCLNKFIQGRDKKQYYLDNKKYIDQKNKDYADNHKEETKARTKKHYELNKEKYKELQKKWREANKEKCREYSLKCYYKNHEESKEKERKYMKRWRDTNKEKNREYMRNYHRMNKKKSNQIVEQE